MYMKESCFFSNSVIFCRVDFNVPVSDGAMLDSKRIDDVIPLLRDLLRNKNKVVIASHFGRPDGEYDEKFSLKFIHQYLCDKLSNITIHFVDDIYKDYLQAVEHADFGEIILLENIRFYKEEEDDDANFKAFLAKPIDIFCNEAFSCSHRAHASIMLAELFSADKKFIGKLFASEIQAIDSALTGDAMSVAIIGGSKVSTKIGILNALTKKVKKIIVVGAMANTFFYSMGLNIGKSLFEKDYIEICKNLVSSSDCEIILPQSVVVTNNIGTHEIIKDKSINNILDDEIIVDASMNAIHDFVKIVSEAGVVLWNGPLGVFEVEPFNKGTVSLAKEIARLTKELKIKSIVGGGDTVAALKNVCNFDDFTHVSTAGGAFLEYIEKDGKLPGILAIKHSN